MVFVPNITFFPLHSSKSYIQIVYLFFSMISFSIYQYSPILPRFINISISTLLSLTLTTRFIDLAKSSLFSFITKERFYISQQYFLEKKRYYSEKREECDGCLCCSQNRKSFTLANEVGQPL